jgi:hypothetical protein
LSNGTDSESKEPSLARRVGMDTPALVMASVFSVAHKDLGVTGFGDERKQLHFRKVL